MKVVLDTNVLVSGIFFGGVPGKILDTWTDRKFEVYVTPNILGEYTSVISAYSRKLAESLKDYWITALTEHAHHVLDPKTYSRICRDPHDDKFLYCNFRKVIPESLCELTISEARRISPAIYSISVGISCQGRA